MITNDISVNTCYSWKTVGIPAPQGSKRHVGFGRLIESSKALKPWRDQIIADVQAQNIVETIYGEVALSLVFCFLRPKGHFTKKGDLTPKAPTHKTTRPDLDKLARAVLDALTIARVYNDDSQVTSLITQKRFCTSDEQPGVMIVVTGPPYRDPF